MKYVHNDHLGRPEAVTSGNQVTVWRAQNYAFDRNVSLDLIGGLNLGFPGQYYDAESDLWSNGYRDYDAKGGRYLQSDPIGLHGGINTYAYVSANPIRLVDPLGLNESQWALQFGGVQSANRKVDYVKFSAGGWPLGLTVVATRHGSVFAGGGVARQLSRSNPLDFKASVSIGVINNCPVDPSKDELDAQIEGFSQSAGVCYGACYSQSVNPATGATTTEAGYGTPSIILGPGEILRPVPINTGITW